MKKEQIKALVDRLALIRQEEKKLKNETEEIKNALLATGSKFIEGNNFNLTIKECERTSLDLERIKIEMGMVWFNERLLTTYFDKFDLESKVSQT